jgi:4-hydroxybenzoate polyprenyltransferase
MSPHEPAAGEQRGATRRQSAAGRAPFRRERFRAVLELLRIPNLPTAVSNVAMGYLVVGGSVPPPWYAWLLAVASASLYGAGMVLNDVCDRDVDQQERPGRPIPSGRVPWKTARNLAVGLLAGGVATASVAALASGSPRPALVASLLAGCVVLYDALLKKTPLAPWTMGCCRFLNVLLGMSIAPHGWSWGYIQVALGVGTYTAGLTLFARTEARLSRHSQLAFGALVTLAGITLLAMVPAALPVSIDRARWSMLWIAVAALLLWRPMVAVWRPEPRWVQRAVVYLVHSMVFLDAAITLGVRGPLAALALLLLWIPAKWLARFFAST